MSQDRIAGAAREGLGRVQDAVGGALGDARTQARGKLNAAAGGAQDAYGQFRDQAADALDQARDIYDQAEEFARQQPGAALAGAIILGLVFGLLLRGGRRTAYVRR